MLTHIEIQRRLEVFIDEVITPRGDKPLNKEIKEHIGSLIVELLIEHKLDTIVKEEFLAKTQELLVA